MVQNTGHDDSLETTIVEGKVLCVGHLEAGAVIERLEVDFAIVRCNVFFVVVFDEFAVFAKIATDLKNGNS